jgi:hypothetical protein
MRFLPKFCSTALNRESKADRQGQRNRALFILRPLAEAGGIGRKIAPAGFIHGSPILSVHTSFFNNNGAFCT